MIFAAYNTNQARLALDQAVGLTAESVGLILPKEPLGINPLDFDKQAGLEAAFRTGFADGLRGPQAVPGELLQ